MGWIGGGGEAAERLSLNMYQICTYVGFNVEPGTRITISRLPMYMYLACKSALSLTHTLTHTLSLLTSCNNRNRNNTTLLYSRLLLCQLGRISALSIGRYSTLEAIWLKGQGRAGQGRAGQGSKGMCRTV